MTRLFEKGLLRRRREGRAWWYRPALTREAYVAATISDALRVASDRRAALLHFVVDMRPDEADPLRRLLERAVTALFSGLLLAGAGVLA